MDKDLTTKEAIRKWTAAGKIVVMATQVLNEGSDMSVYEVGHAVKNAYNISASYDMTAPDQHRMRLEKRRKNGRDEYAHSDAWQQFYLL